MEFGFDKEIDAILRKARGDEVITSFDSHLDADDISAFAENTLPEKVRQNYTAHLADCMRCRKILSNVILLNSEAETETASSVVPAEIAETKTPWYRQLFVFPQIAYTMGALVLLFSGFFGYLILQNLTGSNNSEVSRSMENKPAQMSKSAPAENADSSGFSTSNTASNSAAATNTTVSNSTVTTTTTTNSAPIPAANTATSTEQTERKSDAAKLNAPTVTKPMIAPQATPNPSVSEDDKDLAKAETKNEVKNPATMGAVREEPKPRDKENTYSVDGQSVADATTERQKLKTQRSVPESPNKKASEAGATRNIGGKTFNNVGGIWFDSAYGKQKQKTVTRGTNDYQKLDAGLRSIADNFSGTVVIVWKSKAYRIQ